tara:strand:- start:17145 stop:17984 length:840 start_codon:yes stop_codon:yes gene_type:complete
MKQQIITLFFTILACLPLQAEIIAVSDMASIESEIDNLLERETLSVDELLLGFDIDYTLVAPTSAKASAIRMAEFSSFMKSFKQGIDKETCDLMMNSVTHSSPWKLVEETTPAVVAKYQVLGVKTFAFTASLVGDVYDEKPFEELRYERLKEFGVSFDPVWAACGDCVFEEMPTYLGFQPLFYKGLLCGNGSGAKGDVIVAFLKRLHAQPKVFVMIDDRLHNLEAIEASLKKYAPDVNFIGFAYEPPLGFESGSVTEAEVEAFWLQHLERAQKIKAAKS